jgi:hypothetical protein
MKWVTRENAKVDRIACPWLIRRFIDTDAEFLYVPVNDVMSVAELEGATPFDVPGVELGHVEGRCSFESIVLKYGLTGDPALCELARIVHAADISADVETALEGWGVMAIAHGFSLVFGKNDQEKLEVEAPVYDALYAWCQYKLQEFIDNN